MSKDSQSKTMTQNSSLSPEQAQVLFEQGAMLIFLDFPEGSEFGIDLNSWAVGPNFKGIKMIPAGVHFIYYSSVNSDGQTGPRTGFFYNFAPKEMVVRKWDKRMEDIKSDPVSDDEMQRFESNKHELDLFLGPYPYERYKQWVSLTNHISSYVISLLQPDCGTIYSVAQFESEASTTQSRRAAAEKMSVPEDTDSGDTAKASRSKLPDLKSVAGTSIKYSHIPKKRYPEGSTPAEITKHSMDSSYALSVLLSERFEEHLERILGEIQFAFVCFLVGQNYDSFEQWKRLVDLLCTSGDAMTQYTEAYLSFITILHFQIREIPSDFFVDIVTSNNFLTGTLHELFQNLASANVDAKLKKKGVGLQNHLTNKFKWDFTSEPDDCAPVVVDY